MSRTPSAPPADPARVAHVARLIDALLAAHSAVATAYDALVNGWDPPWDVREARLREAQASFTALRASTVAALAAPSVPGQVGRP